MTPHEFARVPAGVAEVRLSIPGYGEVVTHEVVTRGCTAVAEGQLEAKLGILSILASYSDGEVCEGAVYLDGDLVDGRTPMKLELPARSYRVNVHCPPVRSGDRTVDVVHNLRIALNVEVPGVRGSGSEQEADPLASTRPPADEPSEALPTVSTSPAVPGVAPVSLGPQTAEARRQRTAGVVICVAGMATAATGFGINVGMYTRYHNPQTTDRDVYERASRINQAGLVIGISGATAAIVGIVVAASSKDRSRVTFVPGPVPTLSGVF